MTLKYDQGYMNGDSSMSTTIMQTLAKNHEVKLFATWPAIQPVIHQPSWPKADHYIVSTKTDFWRQSKNSKTKNLLFHNSNIPMSGGIWRRSWIWGQWTLPEPLSQATWQFTGNLTYSTFVTGLPMNISVCAGLEPMSSTWCVWPWKHPSNTGSNTNRLSFPKLFFLSW